MNTREPNRHGRYPTYRECFSHEERWCKLTGVSPWSVCTIVPRPACGTWGERHIASPWPIRNLQGMLLQRGTMVQTDRGVTPVSLHHRSSSSMRYVGRTPYRSISKITLDQILLGGLGVCGVPLLVLAGFTGGCWIRPCGLLGVTGSRWRRTYPPGCFFGRLPGYQAGQFLLKLQRLGAPVVLNWPRRSGSALRMRGVVSAFPKPECGPMKIATPNTGGYGNPQRAPRQNNKNLVL